MNILLIEPNVRLGKTYKQYLEQMGHTVSLCRGAQEAVLAADGTTPDVVVLELLLAQHSGVEFLYEFRSYAEWQHVPIVLHTFAQHTGLELPAELGTMLYLYKPTTTLARLGHVIQTQLQPA